MLKIYRDKEGKLINIGEWEFMNNGEIDLNPLPDDAYAEQAEIVEGYDGGLYLADDPKAKIVKD